MLQNMLFSSQRHMSTESLCHRPLRSVLPIYPEKIEKPQLVGQIQEKANEHDSYVEFFRDHKVYNAPQI